jgi:hypothetical protein
MIFLVSVAASFAITRATGSAFWGVSMGCLLGPFLAEMFRGNSK